MRVSLPTLIVWGLVFPVISLVLLVRNRRKLTAEETKLKYGFLYIGYSPKSYYWEFVIMYRKILIAFISVFLSSVSISIQGLLAFLILAISLFL